MINFDEVTIENTQEDNPNWSQIPDLHTGQYQQAVLDLKKLMYYVIH